MEVKELVQKLEEQAFKLNIAKSNGNMVPQETERMKNVLMNNCDEIVAQLKRIAKMEENIMMLEQEIDDADAELKEKDQQIEELLGNADRAAEEPESGKAAKKNKKADQKDADAPAAGEKNE